MIYLDSSALVKRYVREEGTDFVKSILAGDDLITTSKLSYPEILSALMRKVHAGEIQRKTFNGIVDMFDRDWDHVLVLDFHNDLLQIVKMLIGKHPLKAADAIHLSSALWLKASSKAVVTFVASDSTLLKAAGAEKLHVMNPLDEEK
jgi:predicted nucleic acid-binding protein